MCRSERSLSTASLLVRVLRRPCHIPESSLPSNSARLRTTPRQSLARRRLAHRGDITPSRSPAPHAVPPRNLPSSNSAVPVDDPAHPSHNAIRQTLPPPPQIRAFARRAPSAHNLKSASISASGFPSSTLQTPIPTSPRCLDGNSQSPHQRALPALAQFF